MTWFKPRDLLDRTFEIGIILKGLDGILETIGGLLQILVPPASLNHPQQDPRAPGGATTPIWGSRRITRSCLCWAATASTPATSGSGRYVRSSPQEPVWPQIRRVEGRELDDVAF